jgi:branched-chain amino acid transport system substrate-binding protein
MTPRAAAPLLALALVVAGCSGSRSPAQPSRRVPHGTIVVGFPNHLHGLNEEISNGTKIAVREINGLGGIDGNLKIRLLLGDTKGDPSRAGRLAARFVHAGASMLILPCDSASQRAIAAAVRGKRVILVATCDPDPKLTQGTHFDWAAGMGANLEAAQLADYAKEQGYRRIRVLRPQTRDEGLLAGYFEAAAAARSIQIVGSARQADAIMTPVGPRATIRLLKRRLRAPVIGTHLLDSPVLLRSGRPAERVALTTYGFSDPGFATDQFYETYKSYYGRRPSGTFSALGYEAIRLLDAIVKRAESNAPGLMAQAFKGLDILSVLGEIDYGSTGAHNPHVRVAIVTVKDRRFDLVKKTFPTEVPPA